jgi:hypothetical protein
MGIDAHCTSNGCVLHSEFYWMDVKAWNTRPIEDAKDAEIARLKDEGAELAKALTPFSQLLADRHELYKDDGTVLPANIAVGWLRAAHSVINQYSKRHA